MPTMITITATIHTTPANRDAVTSLCIEHSARSRAEPGCISHHIHADIEDTARLFYYEQWQHEAAVAAHFALPESQDFVKRLTALVGERPDMQIYRSGTVSVEEVMLRT